MTVHYQELNGGGLRAAYLARPTGNIDQVVRVALKLEHTPLMDPTAISSSWILPQEYVLDGPQATIYCNHLTTLQETSYTVMVPKENGDVVVGIRSVMPLDTQMLKSFLQAVAIEHDLMRAGLVPIDSERTQIPATFLRSS